MSIVASKDHRYILYDEAHVIGEINDYKRLREQLYVIFCKYKERYQRMPKTVIVYYNEKQENDFVQIRKLCDLSMFSRQFKSIKWAIIKVYAHPYMSGIMFEKPICDRFSYFIDDKKILNNDNEFILCHDPTFGHRKPICMKY
ncbi:hypothetical protein BLA29_010117, partial [Euroglyphus maynei]